MDVKYVNHYPKQETHTNCVPLLPQINTSKCYSLYAEANVQTMFNNSFNMFYSATKEMCLFYFFGKLNYFSNMGTGHCKTEKDSCTIPSLIIATQIN